MGLDIRLPLGLLFVVTGGMMTVYGLFTRGSAIYEKSLGIDINLVWGLVLAMFGAAMLLLAYLDRRRTGQCSAGEFVQRSSAAVPSARPLMRVRGASALLGGDRFRLCAANSSSVVCNFSIGTEPCAISFDPPPRPPWVSSVVRNTVPQSNSRSPLHARTTVAGAEASSGFQPIIATVCFACAAILLASIFAYDASTWFAAVNCN